MSKIQIRHSARQSVPISAQRRYANGSMKAV